MQRVTARHCIAAALVISAGLSTDRAAAAPTPLDQLSPAAAAKVVGGLPFVLSPSRSPLRPRLEVVPVAIRFVDAVRPTDVAAVAATGAEVLRRADGRRRGTTRIVLAQARAKAVATIAALPRVVDITFDGAPLGHPRPLDVTAAEVEAPAVWGSLSEQGLPVTGAGITICDVDSGIDVFHPLFFRADGGHHSWHDLDGDGWFTPGIDGVDLDGDGFPTVVRHLDAPIYGGSVATPESLDPGFALGRDWLYADDNGNGLRDFGRGAGFDDSVPTFGERWLVADDVNGNGLLDLGEKLVALHTSKIAAVQHVDATYRRGENLIDTPHWDSYHGTPVAGILVGGNRWLTDFVGMVPDAELVVGALGTSHSELQRTDFCLEEGAQVVVHEYAPWVGFHLDGTSPMEELITETSAEGVAHINPVGNLGGSKKQYKREHPSGERSTLTVTGSGDAHEVQLSLRWREPERVLAFVLELGDGQTVELSGQGFETHHLDGTTVQAQRTTSPRDTAMLDLILTSPGGLPGDHQLLHVDDLAAPSAAPATFVAMVADSNLKWSSGAHFAEHVSEDHLLCYPSTADAAIAVAAYWGNGYWGGEPGALAPASGRGTRIDGLALMTVAAPNDPITANHNGKDEGCYRVFGGTSGAAPHVAGAAAMLLQLDGTLDGAAVRDALRAGAAADTDVGPIPNETYGYGKLRLYQSLYGHEPALGTPPTLYVAPATFPAQQPAEVPVTIVDAEDPPEAILVEVDTDYDGTYDQVVTEGSYLAEFEEPGSYVVKLRATDPTGRVGHVLATLTVGEAVAVLPAASEGEEPQPAGCACTATGRVTWGWSLFGLAGLPLAWLRRKRRWFHATS